jgi:alpha-beta hydrolase superfamily lysophospholipase
VVVIAPAGSSAQSTDVTVRTETFVDTTRPSPATAAQPAADSRTLVTTIAIPDGPRRRLPLVVLAHGHNGNPAKLTELIGVWASAGYVVAAPLFPRSSDVGGGSVADAAQQPGDVSFVIDQVLKLAKTKGSPLRGRVDPKHIGLAGLSLGGWTTYGVAFHRCCRDTRVDVVILMSALRGRFDGGEYVFRRLPTLVVHSELDPIYSQSANAYPDLRPPKWFVTLHAGGHADPFENTPTPSDEVARATTIAFWDRYLSGERQAGRQLVAAVDASGGLATLERDLG